MAFQKTLALFAPPYIPFFILSSHHPHHLSPDSSVSFIYLQYYIQLFLSSKIPFSIMALY